MSTSGTASIICALVALGIGAGDEVIVPDMAMIVTANSVRLLGAIPVFADVHPETATISELTIAPLIGKRTKAVVHVSLNNRNVDIRSLVEFCHARGLFVIEDAAQSLGARDGGKHLGTFGDIGTFSLSYFNIISTGQGGVIVTDSNKYASRVRRVKNFGRDKSGVDKFEGFGVNFKFTDLQAVVGLEQMKKLSIRVKMLRSIWNRYYKRLNTLPQIRWLGVDGGCGGSCVKDKDWVPWFIDIYVDDREDLQLYLRKHLIHTKPMYPSIQKVYSSWDQAPESSRNVSFLTSERLARAGLFLPSSAMLAKNTIDYICDLILLWYS